MNKKQKARYALILQENVMEDHKAIQKDVEAMAEGYSSFEEFHKASGLDFLDASAQWMRREIGRGVKVLAIIAMTTSVGLSVFQTISSDDENCQQEQNTITCLPNL